VSSPEQRRNRYRRAVERGEEQERAEAAKLLARRPLGQFLVVQFSWGCLAALVGLVTGGWTWAVVDVVVFGAGVVDRDTTGTARTTTTAALAQEPAMLAFLETAYGPYPFTSFGSIVDDDSVGYALETRTGPVCSRRASESTVLHELAHQWVGDSVTPEQWNDSWLDEASPSAASGCGPSTTAGPPLRSSSTTSWRSRPTTRSGPSCPPTPVPRTCLPVPPTTAARPRSPRCAPRSGRRRSPPCCAGGPPSTGSGR